MQKYIATTMMRMWCASHPDVSHVMVDQKLHVEQLFCLHGKCRALGYGEAENCCCSNFAGISSDVHRRSRYLVQVSVAGIDKVLADYDNESVKHFVNESRISVRSNVETDLLKLHLRDSFYRRPAVSLVDFVFLFFIPLVLNHSHV